MATQRNRKQQAAMDFMVSYGIAIVIIAVAMYVVLRLGVFSGTVAQPTCISAPSFSCGDLAYSANGVVTFVMTQAVGGAINITGAACSSAINVTGNGPQYGNVHLLSNTIAPQFYTNNALTNGIVVYSGSSIALNLPCYSGSGVGTTGIGNPVNGYIWINYTFGNLPPTVHTVQRILQFTSKAT